jgi:hypothetical protein
LVLLASLCGALGCSSSVKHEAIPQPPESRTTATLRGPLCKDQVCTCRSDDAAPGVPDKGLKRFELKLGPSDNELWATVDDMVLYKSREHAEDCFYVDLGAGDHKVSLRARGDNGFGAKVTISELGAAGPWWYDTFEFSCGAPGMCDQETLAAWKKAIAGFAQKHDPCGSTKIKGITWQTGTMPDNIHPNDIRVELTMQVYEFAPQYGPGDEHCARGGSAPQAGE